MKRRTILIVLGGIIGLPVFLGISAVGWVYLEYGNLNPSTFVNLVIGSRPETHLSPSGDRKLVTEVCRRDDVEKDCYLCVFLRVYGPDGDIEKTINTHASDVHKWEVSWISDQVVRMESSDIGTTHFTRQEDGSWAASYPQTSQPR